MFMKQPQKSSFLLNFFVLKGEHKILSLSEREKTSGKFALTKAVSCLQNSVTRTNLTYKEDCFVYNVTHIDILTQHMNFNGNSELFFDV